MEYVLKTIIEGIMDAIEDFFSALTVPSRRYTLEAFFVSLGFLVWSVIAKVFKLWTFVDWQEATTCCILMLVIVLIDSSTRANIKSGLSKIKEASSRFTYVGGEQEESYVDDEDYDDMLTQGKEPDEEYYEEQSNEISLEENLINQEVLEDEPGE